MSFLCFLEHRTKSEKDKYGWPQLQTIVIHYLRGLTKRQFVFALFTASVYLDNNLTAASHVLFLFSAEAVGLPREVMEKDLSPTPH